MAAELRFIGQIAPDLAVGEDAAAQTRSALSRLTLALAERGLGLDDLLRLRLFVRDLGELPEIEGALDAHIGTERPAITVVELPGDPTASGVALGLDAVAAPGAREQRRVGPHGARFGPWVFLGATAAPDPRILFVEMEKRLGEQGAALGDIVKVEGWLTFPMGDYGPLGETRSALVRAAGLLPASAAAQVGRVGNGDERLAFEAIAFVPEDRDSGEARHEATSRLADFYVDARAAGGYVFTSGEVPDGRGSPAEQTREVYERLRAHLAEHGATPADVLQQTVFVRAGEDGEHSDAAADGAVVVAASRAFYGANTTTLPPTTVLAVADFGFRPGCAVEIELIAAHDGRSADAR